MDKDTGNFYVWQYKLPVRDGYSIENDADNSIFAIITDLLINPDLAVVLQHKTKNCFSNN